MTSFSSSHDDFQSLTISEDSTVSEGTRRLLSPYNRNRYDALNREIQNELIKVKETFRNLSMDLNNFHGSPEQLKELKERIRQMNRILLTVKQRQDILDDRNEQALIDLQNHIWEIAKYSVRIEIYLCTIEQMKSTANDLLQLAKKLTAQDSSEFIERTMKLQADIHLVETRAKLDCHNVAIRENLEKLHKRCTLLLTPSERPQLKTLRSFQVKKSILNHCRNRLFD